jgi:hypothetical protein
LCPHLFPVTAAAHCLWFFSSKIVVCDVDDDCLFQQSNFCWQTTTLPPVTVTSARVQPTLNHRMIIDWHIPTQRWCHWLSLAPLQHVRKLCFLQIKRPSKKNAGPGFLKLGVSVHEWSVADCTCNVIWLSLGKYHIRNHWLIYFILSKIVGLEVSNFSCFRYKWDEFREKINSWVI